MLRRTRPVRMGCVLMLVGIIVLGISIYHVIDDSLFLPGTASTQGTLRQSSCSYSQLRQLYSCTLTVQFVTQAGKSITFITHPTSKTPSRYYKGQHVQVQYHLAQPANARINTSSADLVIDKLAVGLGIVLFIVGIVWSVIRKIRS